MKGISLAELVRLYVAGGEPANAHKFVPTHRQSSHACAARADEVEIFESAPISRVRASRAAGLLSRKYEHSE